MPSVTTLGIRSRVSQFARCELWAPVAARTTCEATEFRTTSLYFATATNRAPVNRPSSPVSGA